jgi:hypothetical protein
VPDDQVLNVESLDFGISLAVRKQLVHETHRLLWPPALGSLLNLVALSLTGNAFVVASVWNHTLMVKNIS